VNAATEAQVGRLLDKEAIREVIATYARGVDRCDWLLIRSCFWDDAEDVHGFLTAGPDDLVDASRQMLPVFQSTMHFLGNSIIDVDGDTAGGETYCIAYHRIQGADDGEFDRIVGYRVVDTLQRRSDQWRFLKRIHVFEWSRIDPVQTGWREALSGVSPALDGVLRHWPMPRDAILGRRDKGDPVYELRRSDGTR
jgi:ketosteroid isomerase-like protein